MLRLLEHAFKYYEKTWKIGWEKSDTDKMQYGFKSGKEAIDAILVLRRLIYVSIYGQEVVLCICWLRKSNWSSTEESDLVYLKKKRTPENLVLGIVSLKNGCKTAVSIDVKLPDSFLSKLGYTKALLNELVLS